MVCHNVAGRRSANFTSSVFRELIQNADDANAKEVQIHFETENNDELKDAGVNVRWPHNS